MPRILQNTMKRFLRWLLGIEAEVQIVPVLVGRGEEMKLLTQAELQEMRERWKRSLRGHAQDPEVRVILEMIEFRIAQASGVAQTRSNHAGNVQLVSYDNGEAAGLNDLLLDLVRALHEREEAPE